MGFWEEAKGPTLDVQLVGFEPYASFKSSIPATRFREVDTYKVIEGAYIIYMSIRQV